MENRRNSEIIMPRTTINSFSREKTHGRKLEKNPTNFSHHQMSPAIEMFAAKKLKDNERSTMHEKIQTEVELFHAKKAVKDLVFDIEQSNAKVHASKIELQSVRNPTNGDKDPQYESLKQQLNGLKQELCKLKLDVSSAIEYKAKAEKDVEIYNQKASSSLNRAKELRKEIEEANEEHVLVELARIEAEKELRETESQRAVEALEFSKSIEAAKERISELREEISKSKQLEEKLAATNADISVLQNEMELLRAMEKNRPNDISESYAMKSCELEEMKTVENMMIKAKKELESIKEEGFQFMASMDLIRIELLQVSKEAKKLKKQEMNVESTIERLNSKLWKERSKLDSATSAEERTRGIVSNLRTTLQQLQTEIESAKIELDKSRKETIELKEEIEKTEKDIKCTEKTLMDNISVLETIKASEAVAHEMLKNMVEKMVKSRAMDCQNSSMICISKWEYEYLSDRARLAKEVADKKVDAIHAWIEALKAQEKEILLRYELVKKENKAIRVDEMDVYSMEKEVAAQNTMEEKAIELMDNLIPETSSPRLLIGENSLSARKRRSKTREVSAMHGMKSVCRSPSFVIKKKKREMKTLAALLRGPSGRMKHNEIDSDSYASLLLAQEKDNKKR